MLQRFNFSCLSVPQCVWELGNEIGKVHNSKGPVNAFLVKGGVLEFTSHAVVKQKVIRVESGKFQESSQ